MQTTKAGEWPQDTITAAFARSVASVPGKVFLDFSGERFTYSDVDTLSDELAQGLLDLGVKAGEPVATILDNNIDAVTVWLAINKIGAVSAPVNTAFKGDFLKNQLADCVAKVVIGEDDYVARIAAVADGLPDMEIIVSRGPAAIKAGNARPISLDTLRIRGAKPVVAEITPDQLAMIVYTSGTTGASKGCMLPHNMACNLGWSAVVNHGFNSEDIIWTPLPLFHLNAIATSVVTAMIAEATVAIAPRFSVSRFWPEIERTGANSVGLLGSMAALIAEAPDNEHSRRCYGQLTRVSAAPFPLSVVQKWRDRFGAGAKGSSGYGMTEAATISGTRPDEPAGPPGSSGHGGVDFDLMIVDDNDNEVPRGVAGEIVARPRRPNIMFQGYWKKPDATVHAWRNLWFHTGDLGKLDDSGYLYFVDRKKDYIRRRGENISTYEMEAIFRQHPDLRDLAVHAVLSPLGEDEVKVTAELQQGSQLTEEELCRWSIERVPRFAVPQYVEFREELPRSATGKVLKEQLRAEGKTDNTWDREAAGLVLAKA